MAKQLAFGFTEGTFDKEELIWLAGFFDGEGHIDIAKYRSHPTGFLVVSVTQSDKDILEPFLNFGGIIFIAMAKGGGQHNKKDIWRWQANAKQAKLLLETLLPYLRLKQDVAKIAIEFQDTMRGGWATRQSRFAKRDMLIEKFREVQPRVRCKEGAYGKKL